MGRSLRAGQFYDQDDFAPVVLELTQKLAAYLANREEGFVEDGRSVARPLSALVTTLAAARRGDVSGYPRQGGSAAEGLIYQRATSSGAP